MLKWIPLSRSEVQLFILSSIEVGLKQLSDSHSLLSRVVQKEVLVD